MSIDYQNIVKRVQDLYQDLIYELGKSFINDRPFDNEKILIKFLQTLDFLIYPNTVFTEDNIPVKEIPYEEIN